MTWGLLVLSVNVVYFVVSLVIGIIIGFVFKKWKIGIATFLIIALAPFWDLIIQKINKLNRFVKKNYAFIRRFTAGVKVVEIDALGRLLVPKDLVTFASIAKDVVFSSAVNIVEIWDKDLYEKSISGEDVDFADLAEGVMGNFNYDYNGIS